MLLTESAKFDPEIVAKIKGQLTAGKSVVITSGLLRALQGKGIEDIVEARYTDQKMLAHEYFAGFGSGNGSTPAAGKRGHPVSRNFLSHQRRLAGGPALATGNGYPLLLMDRYSKGVLYVWTMPENFSDLYRLPPGVTAPSRTT